MRLSALTKCYCDLIKRVKLLESVNDSDNQVITLNGNLITLSGGLVPDTTVDLTPFLDNTDDQVISANLTGTDMVITLEDGGSVTVPLASINTDDQTLTLAGANLSIEDGNTIDLAPFLDNTDDQTITGFSLVGNTLVLTIEDGNTVSADLTPFLDNTDDQLLSLVGNTLSIEDGNSIDLSPFLNTDNQLLSTTTNAVTGATNSLSISGGNTVAIIHPGLLVQAQPIYEEHYAGGASPTVQVWNRNLTLTRTAVGRWNATFVGAHPDGAEYHVTATAEEQSGVRDTPDITVVQGSKTAAGFQLQITTGDNGGAADAYVDTPFTVAVNAPQTVVTAVS